MKGKDKAMKYLSIVVLVVLVLMSIAAGGAKAFRMPQEVQFFAEAGIGAAWLLPLGILQILGGALAVFARTRRSGLVVMAVGFLVSSGIICLTGNAGFAAVSLIPVVLCLLLLRQQSAPTR